MPQATMPQNGPGVEYGRDAPQIRSQRLQEAIAQAQSDLTSREMSREEVMQCVVDCAFCAIDARVVGIAIPVGAQLEYHVFAGEAPREPVSTHIATSLTGQCFRERRSISCPDTSVDSDASRVAARLLAARSVMLVPIVSPNETLGVLMAGSDQPAAFDSDDLHTLKVFAGLLSTALTSASAVADHRVLVAERSEAIGQLQTSDALFRALTEHSDELIALLDASGAITYCSPSVTRILGYEARELISLHPADLVHPDDRQVMRDGFAAIVESAGGVAPMRVRLRHKNGSWRHVEGSGRNLLHVPAIHGITCNARDVTTRIESERSLEFQAKLLTTVEKAVIATDLDGVITYWNAFAEKLYGWSASDVMGKPLRSFCVAPEMEAKADEIKALLRARQSWSGEFELRRRDGSKFVARVSDTPIVDATGKLVGVVGVSVDITEQRALEQQLRQAQKMEAVGQLAGGVAHDFNNMLTAIIGYSELALLQAKDGEVHDDLVEIRQAAARAADLTRQLLMFSRKHVLRVETVDVAEAVRGMDKMLRRLVRENIALETRAPDEPVCVEADRSQLEQVILNLVVNARDAMVDGGRLTISIRTSVDRDAGRALLIVTDTGCGMSDEVKKHIFEPFFTTKPEGHGTGLGLSVVFGIVQQLGGTIQVRSEVGVGSIFTIALPLSASSPIQGRTTDAGPVRGSETILLVEDNEPLAVMASRVLRGLGYQVLRAANGGVADRMPFATLATVDLLLTDVVMPELNGPVLVERLRARSIRPAVVYMSGYTYGVEVVHSDPSIKTHFIAKPWTARELSAVIRTALADRSIVQ